MSAFTVSPITQSFTTAPLGTEVPSTAALSSMTSTYIFSAVPTNSSLPSAGNDPLPGENVGSGECRLLGSFSIVIQTVLGGLALLALVYKRWRERPQRPVKVWAFDVSKQVFGSTMLHVANLLASMFSAGSLSVKDADRPNPCSYYLLNLGIDTTIGILFLWLLLKFLNWAAYYTPLADPPESIESGYYGNPPRAWWWFKQSMIYFVGLLIMKSCVVTFIRFVPFVARFGDWALSWTEGNAAVQIFFVMLLFPVCMNALQYYIIDTFIKRKPPPADDDEEIHTYDHNPSTESGQFYSPPPNRQSHHPLLSDMDGFDRACNTSDSTLVVDEGNVKRKSISSQQDFPIEETSSLRREGT
ncbi:hypothetical protein KEM54_000282 [Ascosphaera aggregata]|nr:hypothetical protein KEM54_000282 [Ascosphaera aggregata]